METEALLKLITKPVIKEAIPIFKKLKDNIHQYYNDGFLDYYFKMLNKYKDMKTLLYRQPTSFYDIYYPIKLQNDNKIIETKSLKELFENSNCITIIGNAGSGKSTLLKHFFINSFTEFFKAPIFIPLRDLELEEGNLDSYIKNRILENKLSKNDDILENLLQKGEFIFFLDGYDEINSKLKHEITKKLEDFIDKYCNNKYLLTSRPYSNIEYFKNFINFNILDLNEKDITKFIQLQVKDSNQSDNIIKSIFKENNSYIYSYLSNSLLLTLYIITYNRNSSIPSNKYKFYRRVFDVLFNEHDNATKIGYERELKTKLSQESIEKILEIFSFLSFFDNSFDFDKKYISEKFNQIKEKDKELIFSNNDFIEDMKLSIGLWIEDCGIYQFSHRSLQEYFASVFVSNINNKKNKEKIYNKIYESSIDYEFDIENFLSLCYEMDKEYFIKNYSLKVINNLKNEFLTEKGKLHYKFPFFDFIEANFSGIVYSTINNIMYLDKNIEHAIKIRIENGKEFYKTSSTGYASSYPSLKDTTIIPGKRFYFNFSELIEVILNYKDSNIFHEVFETVEEDEYPKYYLIDNERGSIKSINFFKSIGITEIFERYVKEIEELETELNNQLTENESLESNLINLI